MPPSASWRAQLHEMVSGYDGAALGDQENRVLFHFKEIPPTILLP